MLKQFTRVLIQDNDNRLLMAIKHKDQGCKWNFPGGKTEPNESPLEAGIREVKEETNLVVSDLILLHTRRCTYYHEQWEGFYYKANSYSGILLNTEPMIHSNVEFYSIDEIIRNVGPRLFIMEAITKL